MLAGDAPFVGSPAEVMRQHLHAPLPIEKLADVPQPALALIELLLEKDRNRRLQTPTELLELLPVVRSAIALGCPVTKAVRILTCQQRGKHIREYCTQSDPVFPDNFINLFHKT
jgi:hypothetical protein